MKCKVLVGAKYGRTSHVENDLLSVESYCGGSNSAADPRALGTHSRCAERGAGRVVHIGGLLELPAGGQAAAADGGAKGGGGGGDRAVGTRRLLGYARVARSLFECSIFD